MQDLLAHLNGFESVCIDLCLDNCKSEMTWLYSSHCHFFYLPHGRICGFGSQINSSTLYYTLIMTHIFVLLTMPLDSVCIELCPVCKSMWWVTYPTNWHPFLTYLVQSVPFQFKDTDWKMKRVLDIHENINIFSKCIFWNHTSGNIHFCSQLPYFKTRVNDYKTDYQYTVAVCIMHYCVLVVRVIVIKLKWPTITPTTSTQ